MLGEILWVNGRNTRLKYWLIALAQWVVFIFIYGNALMKFSANDTKGAVDSMLNVGGISAVVAIVSGWAGLCNAIRRYHDRNKSGWWLLIGFIPFVSLWQLIELGFLAGTPGYNTYDSTPTSSGSDDSKIDEMPNHSGSLAKVDDDYIAEYARRYAAEQTAKATSGPAVATQASFGKRR